MIIEVARYLGIKKNFLKVYTFAVGIPVAAVNLWMVGDRGGFGLWCFIVFVSLCGGLVAGLLMWRFFSESDGI